MPPETDKKWLNWPEAFDYMNRIKDPVVKNLIRLVYDKVLRNELSGVLPAGSFDLLYCFRLLHEAFDNYAELHSDRYSLMCRAW